MSRKAIIDVGSNSIKFFVGELAADKTIKTVLDTNDIARLGEGLDATGLISPEAMERNVASVAAFAKQAKELGADQIVSVGTMALRKAGNSAEFVEKVKKACGVEVQIIPGDVYRVSDAIQPSHPLSSPSSLAPNPSQHQGLSNESNLRMRWPKY